MTEISTLKIAASISLGIHLLFLGLSSRLFQTPNILRIPTRYVKVTLLPLVPKEKTDTKIILPIPLKVTNQNREESGPDIKDIKELNDEPFPYTFEAREVPREEPKPLEEQKPAEEKKPLEEQKLREGPKPISDQKEEEISDEQMNIAMVSRSVLDADEVLKAEGNMGSAKEATSNEENLSASLPSFHYGGSFGEGFSYANSGGGSGIGIATGTGTGAGAGAGAGAGTGTGTGYGVRSSSRGGSGKGEGIHGKGYSSLGGGNRTRPRYAENPKPIYPQEAKKKGYEGEVILRVEVLVNGRVGQIEVKKSSGYESLDYSALTTVKQWRFLPAKKDDIAIPLWVNIPIKFQLQ